VRFASVLMGAGTVFFTYLIARQVLPGRQEVALGAAALNAFLPMFLFISGSVNNDNLTWLLCSAALWQLLRMAKSITRNPMSRLSFDRLTFIVLGLTLAAGALTKVSALGLLPLTALTVGYVAWRRRSWRYFIEGGIIVAGLVVLITGWWYWRNLQLYGDWLGMDMFYQVLGTRANPAPLRQLWGERYSFAMAGWGLFGGMNVSMDAWIYTLLNWVAIASVAGLLLALIRRISRWQKAVRNSQLKTRNLQFAILLAWPLIVLTSWSQWARVTWSSQGRLVFSALSAFCVLMSYGLSQLVPGRFVRWLAVAVGGFLLVVATAAPFVYIMPAYAHPPTLTEAGIDAISHRLDVTFGDRMRLLGYDLQATETRPGGTLALTLYWQSAAPMSRNWSVFVHLLDEFDVPIAQRDMYPGQGLYPTTLWPVGTAIASRYVLQLSETAYAPSTVKVEVGLYDYATWERLPASTGGDNVRFGKIVVAPHPGDVPNPVRFNFGDKIALIGYEMDTRAVQAGETLTLTLHWEGLAEMDENYSIFTHVLGKGTQLWAINDSWPQEGKVPTAIWKVGQRVTDPHPLAVHPETPAGVYDVEIGIYMAQTGKRLRRITLDGRLVEDHLLLSKVRVLP
jgi:hypothetical protein